MNGDKFRPEEDLFKSYVLTLTNQLYIVPSARSILKLAPLKPRLLYLDLEDKRRAELAHQFK